MKKIITLVLLFVCSLNYAQNQDKKLERIKNLRIAFISNKLDLTSQEAEKFWPIFNKFDDKQMELLRQKRQLMQKLKPENSEGLTEKDNAKLLAQSEDIEFDMINNRRQFVKELQGVISSEKILLLKKLEDDFKNTLLKQFKERRGRN